MNVASFGNVFIRRVFRSTGTFAIFFAATTCWSASFDCSTASTSVEKAICGNPEISSLDEKMARAYRQVLSSGTDAQLSKQTQRDWLKLVRNVCTSEECLRSAYVARIEDLSRGRANQLHVSPAVERTLRQVQSAPVGASYGASSAFDYLRSWLQNNQVLEQSIRRVGNVRVPAGLRVTAQSCGAINAYFSASQRAIVLCYELVEALRGATLQRANAETSDDALARQMAYGIQYVVLHEFGHAALSVREEGFLGREESAADAFATYALLNGLSVNESAHATWGVWGLYQVLKFEGNPYAEHEYSSQRLASFLCLASATSKQLGDAIAEKHQITKDRRASCARDWDRARRAVTSWSRQG